jgi:nucleotide-binding universal stress UspA family protein
LIVSASYRTDIPAFYGRWFRNRLAAGFCEVVNPYSGAVHTVALGAREVDGFVFWTRNARPFRGVLDAVAGRGTPFVVQYTVTGYPRALEPSVAQPEQGVAEIREIARTHGARTVVWRYDPVVLSSLTPAAWHRRTFADLARALSGAVDEVVLSFMHVYAKTRRNTARAAARHGFEWRDPGAAEKRDLLAELAAIAADCGIAATLCAQPDLLGQGLEPARCIDAQRLADLAGRPLAARGAGNRPGCACSESRDIGAYDSCPHGCVYCYAVRAPAAAKARHRAHDPDAPMLIPAPDMVRTAG